VTKGERRFVLQSIRPIDSSVRPEGAGPTLLELAARLKLKSPFGIAVMGWRSHFAVGRFLSFVVFPRQWWIQGRSLETKHLRVSLSSRVINRWV